jgi:hypothetical protein
VFTFAAASRCIAFHSRCRDTAVFQTILQ